MVIQQLLCQRGRNKDGSIAERKKYLNYGTIRSDCYRREASQFKHKWVFPYLAMYKGTQMTRAGRPPIKSHLTVALYLSGAEGRIVWDELKYLKLLLSKA